MFLIYRDYDFLARRQSDPLQKGTLLHSPRFFGLRKQGFQPRETGPRGVDRMKIGYARVSTGEQNLDLQRHALTEAGCAAIFEDRVSGALSRRPGLNKALKRCLAGDVLVVWKLDRLGRSLLHLVSLVEELKERGVGLKVLTGEGSAVDTTEPQGRMIFGILATLAEFERELIRERTKAGMQAAKRRGVHVGRPIKLTEDQRSQAVSMLKLGITRTEIAAVFGVHVGTLRRALRGVASVQ